MVAITALNGALPSSVLTTIGAGLALRHDAAASYARARAAGAPAGITTAYRTKAQQKALLDLYGYPRAEYPGRSQHGEGVALDIPEPARSWFAAHGKGHGWVRTVMPSEPWHFEYVPGKDTHATATTPEVDVPLTDADMQRIRDDVRGVVREQLLEVLRAPEFAVPTIRTDAAAAAARAQAARDAALRTEQLVTALPTTGVRDTVTPPPADIAGIAAAAEAGARAALADLTLTTPLA